MRKDLVKELNKIVSIENKIYPTNAPQGIKAPYLVYMVKERGNKTLDGYNDSKEANIMLNIMTNSYSQMVDLTNDIENLVKTFPHRNIGESTYIEDIILDEISDNYESELQVFRGIIPFTIYFKED